MMIENEIVKAGEYLNEDQLSYLHSCYAGLKEEMKKVVKPLGRMYHIHYDVNNSKKSEALYIKLMFRNHGNHENAVLTFRNHTCYTLNKEKETNYFLTFDSVKDWKDAQEQIKKWIDREIKKFKGELK